MVKRAHLVTGKGGVGKSLFSAALAYHFSKKNTSVLLTELTEHSFYKDFLSLPEISYKPRPWKKPHLDISQWRPEETLREYALHLLKIESLYKLFFENPVSKSLIQVAPGLQELAILGKLTSSPRQHGPAMSYDEIVVDAHASGHFLSLMRAPAAMNEAIPFGPMGEQSKNIDKYLHNPEFTHIHLVTLPEELPITESIELHQQLKKEFGLNARMYLNKIWNLSSKELSGFSAAAQETLENTITQEAWARKELQKAKIPFTELPLIPQLNSDLLIQALAEHIEVSP